MTNKLTKKNRIAEVVVLILVAVLFLAKLDRHYFFTDELLYVHEGLEHFQSRYEGTLQVPPLPKYLAAVSYVASDNTLGLARVPFALLGVASAYVVYLILKREYGMYYGFGGMALFVASRIIFDASRMIMLEPLLHLAAATEMPPELVAQLAVGGTMVIPIQNSVVKLTKLSDTEVSTEDHPGFAFVPLIKPHEPEQMDERTLGEDQPKAELYEL